MAAALQQDKGGILLPDKPGIEREPITGPETERKRTGEPLPRYPSLYQINTRVWLTELSRGLHRTATLDDIPDADLVLLCYKKKQFSVELFCGNTPLRARPTTEALRGIYRGSG
jgi:hypothetical protein